MIYNCESWSKMASKDIAQLQGGQLHYLRSITEVSKSTPIAAVYPKCDVLPIQYEVELRKLYFIKSILQKGHDDPIRMVYNEMLDHLCENNWANEVMGLCLRYGLSIDDWYVETTGINEWKHTLKSAVWNYTFLLLTSQCKENRKNLCFEQYLQSEYLTSLPPLRARLVFKARLKMYDVKDNFKIKYAGFDLNCPFCSKKAETLQHVLQCDCVPFAKHKTGISSVNVLLQQRHNTEALKKWGKFMKFYDIMRNTLR